MKNKWEPGSEYKTSIVLGVGSSIEGNSKQVRLKCSCGEIYRKSKDQLGHRKVADCDTCKKARVAKASRSGRYTSQETINSNYRKAKFCNSCGEYKGHEEFHKNKSSRDGRHTMCKQCRKEGKDY